MISFFNLVEYARVAACSFKEVIVEHVVISSPKTGEEWSEDATVVMVEDGRYTAAVIDTHHCGTSSRVEAHRAAQAAAKAFREGSTPYFNGDRLERAFACCDEFLLRVNPTFGAVATAIEVTDRTLRVAQLGDTRLYASAWGARGCEIVTPSHTAGDASELARMEEALCTGRFQVRVEVRDGVVTHRLYRKRRFFWETGGLVPTRALGDKRFRPALIAQPEMFEFDRDKIDRRALYVLCSDGAVRAVEHMFGRIRGQAPMIEMVTVHDILEQALAYYHDDDASVIALRLD